MAVREPTEFAALLKRWRLSLGLTQEELAERAGVSARAIGALESGARSRPYRYTVTQLADGLALEGEARSDFEATGRGQTKHTAGSPTPEHQFTLDGSLNWPLVGRQTELEALKRLIAGEGSPIVMLSGEPGIGKTRLLRETALAASNRGMTILLGGSQRRSGQEPFAPLLDMLSRYISAQTKTDLLKSLNGCGWLTRVLPQVLDMVGAPLPLGAVNSDQERSLVFMAISRYLRNIAGPSGSILILDDLQWASADALDLLGALFESGRTDGLRLVGAYRDTEVQAGHPLTSLFAQVSKQCMVDHFQLSPLNASDAASLVEDLLTGLEAEIDDVEHRQHILQRAGGLPYFLVQCAFDLRGSNHPSGLKVPWTLTHSVRHRISSLPIQSQDLLQVAALAGRAIHTSLLIEVLGGRESDAFSGLDAACTSRLLVADHGHEYRFAHDIVREVIETDIAEGQRIRLHRKIAEALDRLPDAERTRRAAEIAWHLVEGRSPRKALEYSAMAADAAERVYAHAEAERHYRVCIELARELGDSSAERSALDRLGWLLRTTARYDEALEIMETVARGFREANNHAAEGEVVARIGWILSALGRPGEAIERLETLAEALEGNEHSDALVAVYDALAHLQGRYGRIEDRSRFAEKAARASEQASDPRALMVGGLNRGIALVQRSRFHDALHSLQYALQAAESLYDGDSMVRILAHMGFSHEALGRSEESRKAHLRAVAVAESLNSPNMIVFSLACLGARLYIEGKWGEARAHWERAAAITDPSTTPWYGTWPRMDLAELCVYEGKWDESARYLKESLAIAERTGHRSIHVAALRLYTLRALTETHGTNVEHLQEHATEMTDDAREDALLVVAELHLRTRAIDRAAELIVQAFSEESEARSVFRHAEWLRLRACLEAERHNIADAEATFVECLSLAQSLPFPFLEARCLEDWGTHCIRHGMRDDAVLRLDDARRVYLRLGAEPYASRVAQAGKVARKRQQV